MGRNPTKNDIIPGTESCVILLSKFSKLVMRGVTLKGTDKISGVDKNSYFTPGRKRGIMQNKLESNEAMRGLRATAQASLLRLLSPENENFRCFSGWNRRTSRVYFGSLKF